MQCKCTCLTSHVEILNLITRGLSKCTLRIAIHVHCHYTPEGRHCQYL